MNHLRQKILITELHDGVIENIVLRVHYLLGYEVLLFCKINKKIKLSKYRCNNYSALKNYDFSILFHRKAKWSEKLYETVFSNIKVNIEDSIESIKFRILIKDVLQRSLGGFDELMYLAELKGHEYTNVKIRCRWSPARSQIFKKNIATNAVTVSFSYLFSVFEHIKKTISPGSLKRLIMLPSSTVQLLGAEEALFRHIKTGARCPKYGVLHDHPLVSRSKKKESGKVARVLASKISIAARVDYAKGKFIGDKLMKEIGCGKDYRYAHNEPNAYAAGEKYFPENMPEVEYYQPVFRGLEIKIKEKLAKLRALDKEQTNG